jgi:hypothetical protein
VIPHPFLQFVDMAYYGAVEKGKKVLDTTVCNRVGINKGDLIIGQTRFPSQYSFSIKLRKDCYRSQGSKLRLQTSAGAEHYLKGYVRVP